MINRKFKRGDKVKCSSFLFNTNEIRCKGRIGTFIYYNKYGDGLSYVYFDTIGEICCFTKGIKLAKNKQLLFGFMEQ